MSRVGAQWVITSWRLSPEIKTIEQTREEKGTDTAPKSQKSCSLSSPKQTEKAQPQRDTTRSYLYWPCPEGCDNVRNVSRSGHRDDNEKRRRRQRDGFLGRTTEGAGSFVRVNEAVRGCSKEEIYGSDGSGDGWEGRLGARLYCK